MAQGSGNGLARSLAHFNGEPYLNDPLTVSVLNVLKLRTVAVDLCLVNTPQRSFFFTIPVGLVSAHQRRVFTGCSRPSMCSFLSVGWGLIADIDIESERLRALGEARFTFWALHRVLRESAISTNLANGRRVDDARAVADLRTYEATVWYRPIEGGGAATPTPLPPLDEPLAEADGWRTQSGSFVCVYSTVAPYLGTDLFLAPDKRPADGVIWLLIIKGGLCVCVCLCHKDRLSFRNTRLVRRPKGRAQKDLLLFRFRPTRPPGSNPDVCAKQIAGERSSFLQQCLYVEHGAQKSSRFQATYLKINEKIFRAFFFG